MCVYVLEGGGSDFICGVYAFGGKREQEEEVEEEGKLGKAMV